MKNKILRRRFIGKGRTKMSNQCKTETLISLRRKEFFPKRQQYNFEPMANFFTLKEAVKHIGVEEIVTDNCFMFVLNDVEGQ